MQPPEGPPVWTDLVDDLPQRHSHGDLDEPRVVDLPDEREDLGPLALLGADGSVPCGAHVDDEGDVRPRFDVVDVRRLPPETLDRREGRPLVRLAAASFDRGDEARFLSGHERTRTLADPDVEAEAGPQDVPAEEAMGSRLLDGMGGIFHGEGILLPHVDVPPAGTDGVRPDDHSLDDAVRVALEEAPVHVGAGVPLVGVADDVFFISLGFSRESPLVARREPRPAPSPQRRVHDFLDDLVRGHRGKRLAKSAITADGEVILEARWVDHAVSAEDEPALLQVEGHFLLVLYFLARIRILVQQILENPVVHHRLVKNPAHVLQLDLLVEETIRLNHDDRPALAETVASRGPQVDLALELPLLDLLPESFGDLQAPVGMASRAVADGDARPCRAAGLDDLRSYFLDVLRRC
jgi:hypothetical protein